MPKTRVPALPNSPSFQQLWEALGSKLMDAAQEKLPSKQVVAGSSPVSRSSFELRGARSSLSSIFDELSCHGFLSPYAELRCHHAGFRPAAL